MASHYVAAIGRPLFFSLDDVVFASLCREPLLGGPSSFESGSWDEEQECDHGPHSGFRLDSDKLEIQEEPAAWLPSRKKWLLVETAAASPQQIDRLRLEDLPTFGQAEIELSKRIQAFSCAVTNERLGTRSDTAHCAVTSWQYIRIVPVFPGLARFITRAEAAMLVNQN
ncbi:hypothetical protein PHBOTO_002390 [Pseudozyma hubeiensis]|nr:hypothetical protein PHBOTO_002390 [Pseudozyma hubeiensis]